jgi:hypothetical protein
MEEAGILENPALLRLVLPSLEPGPFLPFFGTFGAASRRDGSLSKLLQHYEIGHDQCWAGPSKNRLRMGAAEVPYQLPPIVHYLTWLRMAPVRWDFTLRARARYRRLKSHIRASILL